MARYDDFDDDYYSDRPVRKKPSQPSRPNKTNSKAAKKAKNKRKKIITICAIEVVVVILLVVILNVVNYISDKFDKLNIVKFDDELFEDNQEHMDEDTIEIMKGYTNILLIGVDARDNDMSKINNRFLNHSDTMIVCSINNETKEVKMVSIYRDTVLKMSDPENPNDYKYRKATEAIFYYGPQSTMNMMNVNLDLKIDDYVMVNWSALIEIVDAVGGVDIEITEEERMWINEYQKDTSKNTGKPYTELKNSGYVHMDGMMATSYCRIRYTAGSDYKRTERQRLVLSEIFKKAKSMDVKQLDKVVDAIVTNVATSIDQTELIKMASSVASYSLGDNVGFPFDRQEMGHIEVNGKLQYVVTPMTLESNVSKLHNFLFGTTDYVPTTVVQEIGQIITGIVSFEPIEEETTTKTPTPEETETPEEPENPEVPVEPENPSEGNEEPTEPSEENTTEDQSEGKEEE